MNKQLVLSLLLGLIGGAVGSYTQSRLASHAAPPSAPVDGSGVVSATRIRLLDASGKARAELAMSAGGGPALFFYDSQGRDRLSVGLYSAAEDELPAVVLNDKEHAAAGIFRLFGPHETPVVVLKNKGADRSVLGLNPSSTDPFLVNYSADRKKTAVFGDF